MTASSSISRTSAMCTGRSSDRCRRRMLPPSLAAIKHAHPSRIVTVSNSPNASPSETARFAANTALDVTAYHDARVPNWFEYGRLASIVDVLKTNGRPAYLQEPARFPFPSTDRVDYFRLARQNAKRVGAAAWCFHPISASTFVMHGSATSCSHVKSRSGRS
jgi:hypothetical protein